MCLTLYSELFAKEVIESVFNFQLLDPYFKSTPPDEDIAIPSFLATYLERRVLNEPIGGMLDLLLIRRVAERLRQESIDGRDLHEYVKQLCELVVSTCGTQISLIWRARASETNSGGDFETHVFVAAVYTKTMPVVEKWVATGKNGAKSSWLFGSARRHAAKYCSRELLAPMMIHRYGDELQRLRIELLSELAGAGRADAMHFVFDSEIQQNPWEFSREKRPSYRYRNEWLLASIHTPSRDVFDFLMEKRKVHCIDREFGVYQYTRFLSTCARKGWADMVACYLDLGASVNGLASLVRKGEHQRPLLDACENGHQDVVKVLLAYGADTSKPALEVAAQNGNLTIVQILLEVGAECGQALSRAAAKGYRDIVDALIQSGANLKNCSQPLLAYAIEQEYVAMFWLLVEQGCDLRDPDTKAECLKVAKKHGLGSMLELLRQVGADVDHAVRDVRQARN